MSKVDYLNYAKACSKIARIQSLFTIFRRIEAYTSIVGGASYEEGLSCIQPILSRFGENQDLIEKFLKADSIGTPILYKYSLPNDCLVSPDTLRFIRVLIDIEEKFGSLNGLDIVEIGSGYGGQCKIIHDVFKVGSYTIVDLAESIQVARRYLSAFGIDNIIYRSIEDPSDLSYDLCISNYAFSEVSEKFQQFYLKHILMNSKMGYMICNSHTTEKRMKELIDYGKVFHEQPSTAKENFVFTWVKNLTI